MQGDQRKAIKDAPPKYRCYEVTRLLRSELLKDGVQVEVVDGFVFCRF